MKICPDCGQELHEVRVVRHTYYRCFDCDIMFVERGKGAYFQCRELTDFNELPDNGRLPDACNECEKEETCDHYGYTRHGCRSESLASDSKRTEGL